MCVCDCVCVCGNISCQSYRHNFSAPPPPPPPFSFSLAHFIPFSLHYFCHFRLAAFLFVLSLHSSLAPSLSSLSLSLSCSSTTHFFSFYAPVSQGPLWNELLLKKLQCGSPFPSPSSLAFTTLLLLHPLLLPLGIRFQLKLQWAYFSALPCPSLVCCAMLQSCACPSAFLPITARA